MLTTPARPCCSTTLATIADFVMADIDDADRVERFLELAITNPAGAEAWAAANAVYLPTELRKTIRNRAAMAIVDGALAAMRHYIPSPDLAGERLARASRLLRGMAEPVAA